MIMNFIFFTGLLISLKDYFVISKYFYTELLTTFMLSIFPLVSMLIFFGVFTHVVESSSWIFKKVFFFFFFSMFFCFTSSLTIFFLFFLEMSSWLLIFFIFNFGKGYDKISSCIFMFFFNLFGTIPFMFFSFFMPYQSSYYFQGYSLCSSFLLFSLGLILLSKVPLFLFHFWLTKAHVSASGAGSIFLASLMLKFASLGLLKWGSTFSFLFLGYSNLIFSLLIFSLIFFLVLMNRVFDLKHLVACSSILHMSLTFPFIFTYSCGMLYSSSLMMVSHGLTSSMLFFLIAYVYEMNQDRSVNACKSLESKTYFLSMILVLWLLLNLGFPPFASFFSEMMYFSCLNIFNYTFGFIFFCVMIFSGIYFINILLNSVFFKNFFSSNDSVLTLLGTASMTVFLGFSFLCLFFN